VQTKIQNFGCGGRAKLGYSPEKNINFESGPRKHAARLRDLEKTKVQQGGGQRQNNPHKAHERPQEG